jgi:hypothetical protein
MGNGVLSAEVSSRAVRPGLGVSAGIRAVSYLSAAGETGAVAPYRVPACGPEAKAGSAGAITTGRRSPALPERQSLAGEIETIVTYPDGTIGPRCKRWRHERGWAWRYKLGGVGILGAAQWVKEVCNATP